MTLIGSYSPYIPGFTHYACPTYYEGYVYYSSRDDQNRSHIYRSKLDLATGDCGPPGLVLAPGRPGAPDDSGCTVNQVNQDGILYLGWQARHGPAQFNNTLMRYDGGRKIVRQRDEFALSIAYGWDADEGLYYGALYQFHPTKICSLLGPCPLASRSILVRPCVEDDLLWISYRDDDERQYHTEVYKADGRQWVRMCGADIDEQGDEPYYVHVFSENGVRYMLYNYGPEFGREGFRLAKL